MSNNKTSMIEVLNSIYGEITRPLYHNAVKANPLAVYILLIFLKYISDNNAHLQFHYEEKYEFEFLVLLLGASINHEEFVRHIANIEIQCGYKHRILEDLAGDIDVSAFRYSASPILNRMNKLDLTETPNSNSIYQIIAAFLADVTAAHGIFPAQSFNDISLSRLVAGLASPEENQTVYDFAAGFGMTLTELAKGRNVQIFAQDINAYSAAISMMMLVMCGIRGAEVRCGDTITDPLTENMKEKFDRVVSLPPIGHIRAMSPSKNVKNRNAIDAFEYGFRFMLSGDWVFTRHLLASLKPDGVGIILMARAALSRIRGDMKIRKQMLSDNVVDTVIMLPKGVVSDINLETAILICKKNRKNQDVLLLDLSKETADHFIERNIKSGFRITEKGIKEIPHLVKKREGINKIFKEIDRQVLMSNNSDLDFEAYGKSNVYLSELQIDAMMKKNHELIGRLLTLDSDFKEVVRRLEMN